MNTTWTVLVMADHLGFLGEDLDVGDSTPEKAKRFNSFGEAIGAAVAIQARIPDLTQIRIISSEFPGR